MFQPDTCIKNHTTFPRQVTASMLYLQTISQKMVLIWTVMVLIFLCKKTPKPWANIVTVSLLFDNTGILYNNIALDVECPLIKCRAGERNHRRISLVSDRKSSALIGSAESTVHAEQLFSLDPPGCLWQLCRAGPQPTQDMSGPDMLETNADDPNWASSAFMFTVWEVHSLSLRSGIQSCSIYFCKSWAWQAWGRWKLHLAASAGIILCRHGNHSFLFTDLEIPVVELSFGNPWGYKTYFYRHVC